MLSPTATAPPPLMALLKLPVLAVLPALCALNPTALLAVRVCKAYVARPTSVLTPSPSSRLPPAHSTCTADRLDCDAKFLECMKTRCLSEPKEQQESCRSSAGLYHMVCPCHHVTMTVCVRERACVVCAFVYVDVCVAPVHCV
jgi:hypothetical protein